MGVGITYRDLERLSSIVHGISGTQWRKSFTAAIEEELKNEDFDGIGRVASLLALFNKIIWLYEAHQEEFDKIDALQVEHKALKLANEERERLVVEAAEAADVLKKAVEYEVMCALQTLSGHKKIDKHGLASRLRIGANEQFDAIMEQTESVGQYIDDIEQRTNKGLTFSFKKAIQAIIKLKEQVSAYRLFPIDELTAVENEKLFKRVNATDLIFPKKVCRIMCRVCNGTILGRVSDDAFIFGINHPTAPSPLKKMGEQNNRLFLMIYTLSKFLPPERSKVWIQRILNVLGLKRKSYDSKATFCLGSSASTEDREFVQHIRKEFAQADITIPW